MDPTPLTESPTRFLVRWLRGLSGWARRHLFFRVYSGYLTTTLPIFASLPGEDYDYERGADLVIQRLEALGTTNDPSGGPPPDTAVALMASALIDFVCVEDPRDRPNPGAAAWVHAQWAEWLALAKEWQQLRRGPLSTVSIKAWDDHARLEWMISQEERP